MKGANRIHVIAAAALVAGCAASTDEARVGERVLPDTRTVAEHFARAVAMQGPYAFQTPKPAKAARPAPIFELAPEPMAEPAAPSWWARLWPAATTTGETAPPPQAPKPPRLRQSESWSLWEHFWPPLTPAETLKPRATVTSTMTASETAVPAPARAPTPRPAAATEVAAAARTAPTVTQGEGSGLSEARIGALKHAVSFGDAKEQGIDGNVEALFRSPGWLAWAWSPRPHLGITANGSSRATDFLYGGLTWEWTVWDALFVDLGLGLSVHDGMLDNSHIAAKARGDRRELGCRALLRESVELGYRFRERHSLSMVWAHHGNASLCGDDNDGVANAGLRYGLRM